MKLSMVSIDKDGIVRIRADGSITSADFLASDKNPMEALLGANWASNKVLLDLGAIGYIDSSAVGWLINCHKELKANGGMMAVHSIQPQVMQILRVLKIERIMPLVEDEAAARALALGEAK
jgi:anti-anti-sigma factor